MNQALRHLAVIMARGKSRRMGSPKGLCRLTPASQPFAVQICQQYLKLGFSVLVIVNDGDEAEYAACLKGMPVSILTAEGGGGTAETMKLSLDWSVRQQMDVSCFWAHPIDMPLVEMETLKLLKSTFLKQDPGGLRPVFVAQFDQTGQSSKSSQPGHPVLFNPQCLEKVLVGDFEFSTMAQAWKVAIHQGVVDVVLELPINDFGVVTDFDTPEQITKYRQSKEY